MQINQRVLHLKIDPDMNLNIITINNLTDMER